MSVNDFYLKHSYDNNIWKDLMDIEDWSEKEINATKNNCINIKLQRSPMSKKSDIYNFKIETFDLVTP